MLPVANEGKTLDKSDNNDDENHSMSINKTCMGKVLICDPVGGLVNLRDPSLDFLPNPILVKKWSPFPIHIKACHTELKRKYEGNGRL